MELIEEIKKENKNIDLKRLKATIDYVEDYYDKIEKMPKEEKQKLKNHLINTTRAINKMHLDEDTIIAALIHNIPKVYEKNLEILNEQTKEILKQYQELSEIETKNINKIEKEMFTTILIGVCKDLRTLYIRIASKYEDSKIIEKMSKEKQTELIKLIKEVYSPLCTKLGLHEFEWKMLDQCLKIEHRKEYELLKKYIKDNRETREKEIETIKKKIEKNLEEEKIKATVQGRAKSFHSIYKKIQTRKIENTHDILGVRIICDTIEDCYKILGYVHARYEIIPEEYNDYIANPKNGYKSIHTTAKYQNKEIEVQIRTWEQHREVEQELYWKYKGYKKNIYDERLHFTKQLIEWRKEAEEPEKFMKTLKIENVKNDIFVFTPKKEIIILPENSTPLDFAFYLHTQLGLKCQKAKVNGKMVPLDYKLKNMDNVEIITNEKQKPKSNWLNFIQLKRAQQKIRSFLGITKTKKINELGKKIQKIKTKKEKTRIAKCCNPVLGDAVIGIKTSKRKIIIHKKDCKNLYNITEDKKIEVEWEGDDKYKTKIKIRAVNRPGIAIDIMKKLTKEKNKIIETQFKSKKNEIECIFLIEIKNIKEIEKIIKEIDEIPGIKETKRETN